MTPTVLWPSLAGLFFLTLGLIQARRELAAARGPEPMGPLDRLVALGRPCVAAALGAFGAEHLSSSGSIVNGVPGYMPARLFWVYFVGVALLAAALSIALDRYVRWSAMSAGTMVLLFVAMIHLPNLAANPSDRIVCAVVLRDLAFAGGLWALAASRMTQTTTPARGARQLLLFGRISVAVAALFFAIEHGLHPTFAPGVPLAKVTPGWVPVPAMWGYIVGACLFAGGLALLLNWRARSAAGYLGLVLIALTVFLYTPIMLMSWGTPAMFEGMNYVADTLLYAGTLLALAAALDCRKAVEARYKDSRRSRLEILSSPSGQ